MIVKTETPVIAVTTESKTSITQKSTRPSSVKLIPIESRAANMAICVRSLTTKMSSPSICFSKWRKTWTSSCSTTKLFGVHSVTRHMLGTNVYTHTIGRTSAGSQMFMNTYLNSVRYGSARKTRRTTRTDALWNIAVDCVTGGKSSSFTHNFIRH